MKLDSIMKDAVIFYGNTLSHIMTIYSYCNRVIRIVKKWKIFKEKNCANVMIHHVSFQIKI